MKPAPILIQLARFSAVLLASCCTPRETTATHTIALPREMPREVQATRRPPSGIEAGVLNAYPNEPDGYRFFAQAKWRTLRPLESTMAEVLRVLGEPSEKQDIGNYSAPYPGDEKALQPVFTYPVDDDWYFLVYFVRSQYDAARRYPTALGDRLFSVEYIPKKHVHFERSRLSPAFSSRAVFAADASWDTLADGSGLSFEIYTKPTRGGNVAGDLNRIVYGPSDEAETKHVSAPVPLR